MKFEDRHPAIYEALRTVAGILAGASVLFAAWTLYCAIW